MHKLHLKLFENIWKMFFCFFFTVLFSSSLMLCSVSFSSVFMLFSFQFSMVSSFKFNFWFCLWIVSPISVVCSILLAWALTTPTALSYACHSKKEYVFSFCRLISATEGLFLLAPWWVYGVVARISWVELSHTVVESAARSVGCNVPG